MIDQERTQLIPSGDVAQVLGSVAITLISVVMLLGGILLSQLDAVDVRSLPTEVAELSPTLPFWPTSSPTPTSTPLPSSTVPPSVEPPTEQGVSPTIPSLSPTPPSTLIPRCSPPAGWVAYTVKTGETLYRLAWRTGSTAIALIEANCLSSSSIYPGQQIYLPPTLYVSPTPGPTAEPCGVPLDWVHYTVRPGDTLFGLSRRFGVSIGEIRYANCMSVGEILYAGTVIFVPPLPATPIPTDTPTPPMPTQTLPSSLTPSPTSTRVPPTWTPTPTEYPTLTASPTVMTGTGTHTPTHTPSPTGSATSTYTPTPTPTEFPTHTVTPTVTPTESPTPTDTRTPTPTTFPTSTFTPTPTPTPPPTSTSASVSS